MLLATLRIIIFALFSVGLGLHPQVPASGERGMDRVIRASTWKTSWATLPASFLTLPRALETTASRQGEGDYKPGSPPLGVHTASCISQSNQVTFEKPGAWGSSHCGSPGSEPDCIHEDVGSVPGLTGLGIRHCRELWCRLQLRLGFDPWPENFCVLWVCQGKKNYTKLDGWNGKFQLLVQLKSIEWIIDCIWNTQTSSTIASF